MSWFDLLLDARTPVALRAVLFGGMAGAKFLFALITWRSDFPSRAALLVSLWCAVTAAVHVSVLAGADWREVVALQWVQTLSMAAAWGGAVCIIRWKLNLLAGSQGLQLRVLDLEDKVYEIRAATGYRTDHPPQPTTPGGDRAGP